MKPFLILVIEARLFENNFLAFLLIFDSASAFVLEGNAGCGKCSRGK
jgi:hypothetical protein